MFVGTANVYVTVTLNMLQLSHGRDKFSCPHSAAACCRLTMGKHYSIWQACGAVPETRKSQYRSLKPSHGFLGECKVS